jgi:hypothetical protein
LASLAHEAILPILRACAPFIVNRFPLGRKYLEKIQLNWLSRTALALFVIQLLPLAWLVVTSVLKLNDDSFSANELLGGYLVYIHMFFLSSVSTLPMALGTLAFIFALTIRLSKYSVKPQSSLRALKLLAKPWIASSLFALDLILLPKEGVWAGSSLVAHLWVIATLALIWFICNFKVDKTPRVSL